jgi:asparagine synthase (glutamine-hydrolysing)
MCGICGIVSQRELTPPEFQRLGAVNARLSHRGPDSAGEYSEKQVALAMRRLSIIDLDGGSQPLFNEDRSLVLIANAEIYNYVELQNSLSALGHRFTTGSDCETILHAYEEFGLDCLRHLRGMFAFALWDTRRRRLLLARDRMGEKPLYFYESEGQLIFASELKALLRSGWIPFELDPEAVNLFFHYQYVPEPLTPIKGVRKLEAAHLLTLDVDEWRVTESCYWRMEDAPPLEGDAGQLIREQLEIVSEQVMRSDVPVGVALSGGLDSSVVAALASRNGRGQVHAFSVGYSGRPESDERAEAQQLAQHLGLHFHEVELDTDAVVRFFPELNYWRDDPIADIAGHSYYAVMKLAHECGVPVVLQGQGGDELFWGYPILRQAALESSLKEKSQQHALRAPLRYISFNAPTRLARQELSTWARDFGGLRTSWQRFQKHRRTPAEQLVFYDLSPDYAIARNETPQLYGKDFADQLQESSAASLFTVAQPWPNLEVLLTRLVCATYLRENGVAQGDRLSMASSVEMRLPFLDHRLVETIIGLRKTQSDSSLPAKSWLRKAVTDLLPAEVLERPKRGFTPPVRKWHDALFAAYGDSVREGFLIQSGVLSRAAGERLASGPISAGAISPLSFKALVLEQWCRGMLAQHPSEGLNGKSIFA